jgi:hypothetical protein
MNRFVMGTALACFLMPALVKADSSDVDRKIVGAWKLQFTTPDGVQRTPFVILGRQYSTYVAWYIGDKQPEKFRDVQLKGDTLVGTINPQEHPGITVTLESKLQGENQCVGTATFRSSDGQDTGQWTFRGQRMTPSTFDEATTWKLNFVTPDNQKYEPTITVVTEGGKMYAWFSGRDHELPARSITVQGDNVVMSMTAETPEGAQVDVTFRGTVSGDEVKGMAEYRLGNDSGSFPFLGKRAS